MSAPPEQPRRKGIYLLPNLFTTAALFSGFYAIVAAISEQWESASLALFIAMVLDGLDGRVARLTNTQSDFGKEYDSLADMVSFGLAPALVIYEWSLHALAFQGWVGAKVGWLAAFMYAACAALRLARFNTQTVTSGKYFFGLPSPAAAAIVAGLVWVSSDLGLQGEDMTIYAVVLTVLSGGLMVSNVKYDSFKNIRLGEKVPFIYMLILVLVFMLIAFSPPQVLFGGFVVYMASGLVLYAKRRHEEPDTPTADDTE